MLHKLVLQFSSVFVLMTVAISVFAQDKVVVVPLGGDTVFQVKSGELLSGNFGAYTSEGESFGAFSISFPAPLPSNPGTITISTPGQNSLCTGPGVAPSGVMCIYVSSTAGNSNVDLTSIRKPDSHVFPHTLYGMAFYFNPINSANFSFLHGTWTYRVK